MGEVRRVTGLVGSLMRLVTLVGCVLLPAGCSGVSSSEDPTPTHYPTPIVPINPTYEVQRGEVVSVLEFRGRVVPVVEEELYFRTSGYVDVVNVRRDDMVRTGDLLAELEVTDVKNQLAQAKADLEMMRVDTEQRRAEAEAALRIAELRLAKMTANSPSPQVVIAEVGVERAHIALSDAQETYDETWDPARDWELNASRWSREALEAEREATERALRQAELSLQVAEAQYQQAVQTFTYDVQIMEQEVALASLRLQEIEAGLDLQRVELEVKRLEDQITNAQVVAPFDGQVMMVSITDGRAVDAYQTVIVLADPGEQEVKAYLPGSDVRELTEGMPVSMRLVNRAGGEIQGYIRQAPYGGSGGSEGDGAVRVALEPSSAGTTLELNDLVNTTVVLERRDNVLWLPPQAIRIFEGRDFVVVQEGDAQRRVDVTLGLESDDRVEIEEGLSEGQIVLGP